MTAANIAVIGSGIAGLSAAWLLSKTQNVTLFEKNDRLGGHSNTIMARVADGASGGGISYGYRAVPGQPGKHEINEREAAVVRRIFADYVAGATPREIASPCCQKPSRPVIDGVN